MKKKLIAGVLTAVMAVGMLTGCGGSSDSKKSSSDKMTFEIVSKGFQSTYWQAVYKGAKAKAEELGVEINMVGPNSESDVADQVQMLNSAINANPPAIGLAALDTDACLDAIQSAMDANIPIIGFDSGVPDAPEGAVYANAATDNYAAGAVAADGMYEGIKDKLGNGQVRIGEVNQDATSESITQRGLGFIDKMIELLKADGYKVAVIGNDFYVGKAKGADAKEADADVIIEVAVPAETTTSACQQVAEPVLQKADTIAVFGSNQVSAEGIVNANETLKVCGPDGIVAVGFDSGSVLKAAVTDKTLYGAVTQAPVSIGEQMVQLLYDAANGKDVKDVDTGCQWYNSENITSEEIAQNLYD